MNAFDSPIEAEAKYRVSDLNATRQAILALGANLHATESHCDTYLRHPTRDFRATDEALRIREISGIPYVTYKGPRFAGPIKIRPEVEVPLVEGTVTQWLSIWQSLSFTIALQVRKSRESYQHMFHGRSVTITLDQVESLGCFVEIELILDNKLQIDQAQIDIQSVALQLGLHETESRSYLGMLLAKHYGS